MPTQLLINGFKGIFIIAMIFVCNSYAQKIDQKKIISKESINQVGCSKISGLSRNSIEMLVKYEGVSLSQAKLVRSEWYKSLGGQCFVVIDTPKRMISCKLSEIFTDDAGKTTYGNFLHSHCD